MSVTRSHRLLLLLLMAFVLLVGATLPTFAKANWHTPEDIYRVDVVIFSHINDQVPIRASETAHDFSHVDALAYARDPIKRHAEKRTADPWDFAQAIEQWVYLAMAHTQGPVVGPTQPLQTEQIMLGYPIVEKKLRHISADFASTLDRLRNSSTHEVLLAEQWHQPLPRGPREAQWRMTSKQSLLTALDIENPWLRDHSLPPGAHFLDGTIAFRRDQFFRISIDLWWQQTSTQQHGPLMSAFLYPSGLWLSPLRAERVVPLNQWIYFDSQRLGALIRVQPFNQPR